MATDCKLHEGSNEDRILFECNSIKATASDFMLDSPARRSKPGRPRRALVHDQKDGLTINYNRDYPGGVTINDVVSITNRKTGVFIQDISELSGVNYTLQANAAGGAKKALVIRGEILIESKPAPVAESLSAAASREPVSLQILLGDLGNKITDLADRVASLERVRSSKAERS